MFRTTLLYVATGLACISLVGSLILVRKTGETPASKANLAVSAGLLAMISGMLFVKSPGASMIAAVVSLVVGVGVLAYVFRLALRTRTVR